MPPRGELTAELIVRFRSKKFKPPTLPRVARDVVTGQRGKEADLTHVRRAVESDRTLADRVLTLASSPLYTTMTPPRSLQDALLRLGMNTLGEIILEVMLGVRVFRAPHYGDVMGELQRHSIATAHNAREVARAALLGEAVANRAFLCGMLHDVGAATALCALADMSTGRPAPKLDDAWTSVVEMHERVGSWLAKRWEMPKDIGLTMACHHQIDDAPSKMCTIVSAAEALAAGAGHNVRDEVEADQLPRAMAALDIDAADVDRLVLRSYEIAQLVR